ncbi:PREDICTED: uncharacterized protein LOC109223621 isoform X2 [Nicotiana attenuata]|uniref:Uncharacterized protein n=1 Tax=Nicotiana attenuata TaxID=49451 RepID=A0A1J6J1D2_NICAT|nr:PREDICTED: uncharacterized protein LOC109223621 isoform X2 [Nicotiana attenuata]OIT04787.1 hypothetical protein A4A49_04289 [Nicotiana attenuata]
MDGITPRKATPSLSSPNKPSAVPDRSLSGSRETNENDQPLVHKTMTKNFMSPTISAASKASVPIRKKILAERNEISSSCENHPQNKSSNLGSKTNSLNSTSHHRSGKLPISNSYSYASESDNDQENNFVVDSSYKPYDPLTNDLGPRPKYLRYKPNRRRRIILDSNQEIKQGDSRDSQESDDNEESLEQVQDSLNLPEKHTSNLEVETEEDGDNSVDEDEEQMEEVVERKWGLKGLFKILLLLVVFFLLGSNLSSINSMVSSENGDMIRKNIFEAVFHETYRSGSVPAEQLEYSQSGFLELSQRGTSIELKAVEFVEDVVVGFLNVENADIEKTGADIGIEQDNTVVNVTDQSVHGDEEEETMSKAAGEVTSSNEVDEEEVEDFHEQLQKDQVLEKDSNQDEEIMSKAAGEVTSSNEVNEEEVEPLLDDISSTSAQSSYKFEQAEAAYNVEQVEEISVDEELTETEFKVTEVIDTEYETSNLNIELESNNAEIKETGLNNAVIVIGVSALSVLLVASLVTIYISRKVRASIETPQVGTFNVLEEKNETSVVKVSSLSDPSENLRNFTQLERTPAIGSITAASSLFGPKKEASKEISQISAPNVELLEEMVLEEVSSSSLRSYVRKNNTIEAEENSNTKGSKVYVVDHSKADSASYGSFTAEKKIIKKKVEKDGEEIKKMVLTTPVRRSSRIAAMSP